MCRNFYLRLIFTYVRVCAFRVLCVPVEARQGCWMP